LKKKYLASRGLILSFQITVLKVLAGHPEGRASLADLRHAVGILISSGRDWTDRTKRLAARAPGLDIFSQTLVLRDADGWQITDAGRTLLASLETPTAPAAEREAPSEAVAMVAPAPILLAPPIRLVHVNRCRQRRRRTGQRPSAVA
jgi:hypothetical protein